MKKLQKVPSHLDEYDEIIQNQLKQGIVERVSDKTQEERECHLLHKAVIREAAQSTKMRTVFDALAKANQGGPSLNDCLQTGLPLKNLLGSLMVWNRLKPVALCGDIIKQAFLQVPLKETDGDTFRFHG